VSPARRAGAPRLIDWTGERCVPWTPDVQVLYEHYHRYLWAASVVAGRRVLDLGSGEGFGAAILADAATQVVGVDIDERTVEHSQLNYGAANVEFSLGSALDLSRYETGSFGAVVAFEIIEHIREQELVLAEIARVLADDGILVISTPDRRIYSEVGGQSNPFHERELGQDEFLALLGQQFSDLALWGQRTITGSHLRSLGSEPSDAELSDAPDFYLERSGDEWRLAGHPAALYLVALASNVALPSRAATSTLADCGLELMRLKERDAAIAIGERDAAGRILEQERAQRIRELHELATRMNQEVAQRDLDIEHGQQDAVALRAEVASRETEIAAGKDEIAAVEAELAAARLLNRRTEESVTWQAFQRVSGRLYAAIGERSLLARAIRLSLRIAGRMLIKLPKPPAVTTEAEQPPTDERSAAILSMPEYEDPKVSLIIPLHARPELTYACLRSIRENTTHASYEVILVDDAADAETKLMLEGVSGAQVLRNEQNSGYLRSVNRGASVARGHWLVLFNNDTEVTPGWLSAMLDCAESADDIGVVTPKYLYPDGSLNEAGGIIWRDGTGMNYGRGDPPDRFQYEYRRETDYGSAAALMVSSELWEAVGGFDERYLPMYYEDADLCFAAREHGKRVLYEPSAVVMHIEGATAGNDSESGHKRHQEQNRPKFVAKWRHRLEAEQLPPGPKNVRVAANRGRGPHVLVIDHCVPMWDRDAGSLRMLSIMRGLLDLGARVTFMPDNLAPIQPYARRLQSMGIEVLYGSLDVSAELATIGPGLTMAILSRPHPASRWLDAVREFAPSATIVYDTVDLHWLREARRSALAASASSTPVGSNGSLDPASISPRASALRELELAMIRATDMTMVVSEQERAHVKRDVPDAQVLMIPTVHAVEPYVPPPDDRTGILFVGGFGHPPNIGAATRLVNDVMPAVWRELGEVPVTIVGSDPPPEVLALASPRVDVAGWVEDLRPLLDGSRVLVAPLGYGAGLKGKITQCLAAGLPVVTTAVGAEGLDGLEDCLLIAEQPAELAERVVRLYRDDALWRELSRAGQALVEKCCSPEVISDRLGSLLELADPTSRSAPTHIDEPMVRPGA
jgi:GT2 family glycosyltransferase/SAM-dependent methyltransferase/glycosyltransferase involved in cell wall biosynthesis